MKTPIISISILLLSGFAVSCDSSYTDSGISGDSSSGKGGSLARFAIVENSLYTLTNNSLKYYDITQPSLPAIIDSSTLGNDIETIFPYGNFLFIGTQNGMLIYNVSNPASPYYFSHYEHIYSCDPVVVQDNYAYVTLNSNNTWCGRNVNRLEIIDISNLSNPNKIAEYPMQGPLGLGVDDNLLFVCDNGLKVYNIANKQNIQLLKSFSIKANDVIPNDTVLLVTGDDGLYQYSYNGDIINLLSKIPVEKEITP